MSDNNFSDTDRAVSIHRQETAYTGAIWNVQRDTFTMHDGEDALTREYIDHPGAVAIVAIDEHHRVAMIQQYRLHLGQDCWEIQAGILDVVEEQLFVAA